MPKILYRQGGPEAEERAYTRLLNRALRNSREMTPREVQDWAMAHYGMLFFQISQRKIEVPNSAALQYLRDLKQDDKKYHGLLRDREQERKAKEAAAGAEVPEKDEGDVERDTISDTLIECLEHRELEQVRATGSVAELEVPSPFA